MPYCEKRERERGRNRQFFSFPVWEMFPSTNDRYVHYGETHSTWPAPKCCSQIEFSIIFPLLTLTEGTSLRTQYDIDGSDREWEILKRFVKMIWSCLSNLRHLWLISLFLYFTLNPGVFYIECWDGRISTKIQIWPCARWPSPEEAGNVSWTMNVYVWLVLTLPHVTVSSPVLLMCDCKICPKILEK